MMKSIIRVLLIVFVFTCVFIFQSLAHVDRSKPDAKNNDRGIVLCTWNIAHYYAYGSAKNVIDGAIYDSKLKAFRKLIYDSICADVLSLNEYSQVFGYDKKGVMRPSADVLFNGYKTKYEGGATRRGVGHNAVYSNVNTKKLKKTAFKYIKTTKYKRLSDYYYITSDISIDGEKVILVSIYLIHSKKDPSLVQGQIAELIDLFKDEQRIVMCGDFNTSNYSKFKKAGYSMANDGSIVTFSKTSKPLDNIVAKGVKISDVRTVKTELSDHYPLICRLSIK